MKIALALDIKIVRNRENKRPLHGILVLIQDNFFTSDKMETTSGSERLKGIKPKKDADVVAKLREAGAIILGKTNLSEFSGFGSEYQGYSERRGQVINPLKRTKKLYEFSSGAAIAKAYNLAAVALDTSMEGSI